MELAFAIPGPPVTWKRVNHFGGLARVSKKQRAWKLRVSNAAFAAIGSARSEWVPLGHHEARFEVTIGITEVDGRRGDVDNFAKGVLDGCNGVLWHDDRQVDDLHVKRWPPSKERPGVSVLVKVLT